MLRLSSSSARRTPDRSAARGRAQAYYSFLLESAWRSSETNVSAWLQQWGTQRCGGPSDSARRAWALLAETVYADSKADVYEHHMAYCPTTMPQGSGCASLCTLVAHWLHSDGGTS